MLSSKKTVCVSASALMPVSMSLRMSAHPVWLGLAVWVEINVVPLAFTRLLPSRKAGATYVKCGTNNKRKVGTLCQNMSKN